MSEFISKSLMKLGVPTYVPDSYTLIKETESSGDLYVSMYDGKCYWLLESRATPFDEFKSWEEIPQSLYAQLIKYSYEREITKEVFK